MLASPTGKCIRHRIHRQHRSTIGCPVALQPFAEPRASRPDGRETWILWRICRPSGPHDEFVQARENVCDKQDQPAHAASRQSEDHASAGDDRLVWDSRRIKPNFQFPGGAWLTRDGANHRIALLRWIDEGPFLTGKCIRHHIWRHRGSATGRPAPKPS